jgi:hypothetical protein
MLIWKMPDWNEHGRYLAAVIHPLATGFISLSLFSNYAISFHSHPFFEILHSFEGSINHKWLLETVWRL